MPEAKSLYKFYTPTPAQTTKFKRLQSATIAYHELLEELCPNSRHRSMALSNLEMAYLVATRAIAFDGKEVSNFETS